MISDVAGKIVEAQMRYKDSETLNYYGNEMFRFSTELGFPADMFLAELERRMGHELPILQKLYIFLVYQSKMIEHKRLAGTTEASLDRTRKTNLRDMETLIKHGNLI